MKAVRAPPKNQNEPSRIENDRWHPPMNPLQRIWLTFVQLVRQAGLLPQTITNVFKERRLQAGRNELEAERLDRIRNPSKYRGK
jgi:hypothetical protein